MKRLIPPRNQPVSVCSVPLNRSLKPFNMFGGFLDFPLGKRESEEEESQHESNAGLTQKEIIPPRCVAIKKHPRESFPCFLTDTKQDDPECYYCSQSYLLVSDDHPGRNRQNDIAPRQRHDPLWRVVNLAGHARGSAYKKYPCQVGGIQSFHLKCAVTELTKVKAHSLRRAGSRFKALSNAARSMSVHVLSVRPSISLSN